MDETQIKVKGEGITWGFLTDPESGQIAALEVLASREALQFERWLSVLLEHFGCEVVVSDDLAAPEHTWRTAGARSRPSPSISAPM